MPLTCALFRFWRNSANTVFNSALLLQTASLSSQAKEGGDRLTKHSLGHIAQLPPTLIVCTSLVLAKLCEHQLSLQTNFRDNEQDCLIVLLIHNLIK